VTGLSITCDPTIAKDRTHNEEPKHYCGSPIPYMTGDSKRARWQLFAKSIPKLCGMNKEKLLNTFGPGKLLKIEVMNEGGWHPEPGETYWYVIEAEIDKDGDGINETGIEVHLFADVVLAVTLKQTGSIVLGSSPQ
jgi:hypothetical protein